MHLITFEHKTFVIHLVYMQTETPIILIIIIYVKHFFFLQMVMNMKVILIPKDGKNVKHPEHIPLNFPTIQCLIKIRHLYDKIHRIQEN